MGAGPTNWAKWQPNQKSQLTLSPRDVEEGEMVEDDVDAEVRTTVQSQICAGTPSSEEPFV